MTEGGEIRAGKIGEDNAQSRRKDGTGSSVRSNEANPMNEISKTYHSRPKFGGGFDDDFHKPFKKTKRLQKCMA
jgi:hypothetical protein